MQLIYRGATAARPSGTWRNWARILSFFSDSRAPFSRLWGPDGGRIGTPG